MLLSAKGPSSTCALAMFLCITLVIPDAMSTFLARLTPMNGRVT
jgi:hypothetical protein